jgi:hypothetical protein
MLSQLRTVLLSLTFLGVLLWLRLGYGYIAGGCVNFDIKNVGKMMRMEIGVHAYSF